MVNFKDDIGEKTFYCSGLKNHQNILIPWEVWMTGILSRLAPKHVERLQELSHLMLMAAPEAVVTCALFFGDEGTCPGADNWEKAEKIFEPRTLPSTCMHLPPPPPLWLKAFHLNQE